MKSDHAHRNANSETVIDGVAAHRQHDGPERAPAPAPSIWAAWQQLLGDAGHERGEDQHRERHGQGRVGDDQARRRC